MNIYISGSYKQNKNVSPWPNTSRSLIFGPFQNVNDAMHPHHHCSAKKYFFLQENLGFRTRRARHLASARLHGTS